MLTTGALSLTLVPISSCLRLCLPALLVSLFVPHAVAEEYVGKPFAGFEFDPPRQTLTKQDLAKIIGLAMGDPVTPLKLREVLQRLYSTGEYRDISVNASLDNGQVSLRFQTTPSAFIGDVTVDGAKDPPNTGQLESAAKLQLGTEYNQGRLAEATNNLRELLKRNGFYNSTITSDVITDPDTQQVNIHFKIASGQRARFDDVVIVGTVRRSPNSIVRSTGWKGLGAHWRPFTESRLQSGIESIRKYYQTHDHLLAKVKLGKLDYHGESNRVTPTIEIEEGPKVLVAAVGTKISRSKLRQLLPIYEERSVDKDLLVEGSRNLLEYYRAQGYFDATVDYSVAANPDGSESIAYSIDKSARHRFVSLRIQGNKYFDLATLRERMLLRTATYPRFPRGRYSLQYLERDLDAIRDLYRSNGFREIDFVTRQEDDFQGKVGQIGLSIQLNEGPQSFVSALNLKGVEDRDRSYFRGVLHSTEGQPFSDLNIATDRDTILGYFFDQGYPNAALDYESLPSDDAHRVNVTFTVKRGDRQFVRDVLVGGLRQTRRVLTSRSISVKPGEALSQTSITESQRRLYDLGIFAKVQTALENPDGLEPSKNVLYKVEEASRYSVNAGVGAEIARIGGVNSTELSNPAGATGFSPRVSLGISRLNLFGLGHTASLQTRFSTLQQRALLSYLVPRFKGARNFDLQFTALFDESRDVRTFSARRLEGSVQFGERLSKSLTAQYRFTYRKVNILGTPFVNSLLIPQLQQPVRVGLVSTTLIQDRRDDPTDPRSGVYNTLDIGLASGLLGSETGFWRVLLKNATYHRLGKDFVLARYTTLGDVHQYSGACDAARDLSSCDIPLAERFFGGGSSTHRGFPDNQAGQRDPVTGFPLGGRALLFNTVELRFPLFGDNFGGVLFHDIGNVYTKFSAISLRFRQRDLQDFDYAVQSAGIGLRYRTPVGPIRVDLALSPDPPRFYGFRGTIDQLIVNCKNPVTGQTGCATLPQRMNVFQFHFSLGQPF